MEKRFCEKCKGTGIVKEADGSVHTCFDCLLEGRMDQHDIGLKSSDGISFRW